MTTNQSKVPGYVKRQKNTTHNEKENQSIKTDPGTSLVVQLLRICLPMQGTWVNPWSGKIPCAVEQLSPCSTTTEPVV